MKHKIRTLVPKSGFYSFVHSEIFRAELSSDPHYDASGIGAEIKYNWVYGSDEHSYFRLIHHGSDHKSASVKLSCTLPGCKELIETIDLSNDGVKINVSGDGHLALLLPAFEFDGGTAVKIDAEEKTLTISYKGWHCHYSTNGTIANTNHRCTNRNGIYQVFRTEAENSLDVQIVIEPAQWHKYPRFHRGYFIKCSFPSSI